METKTLTVNGMMCAACAGHVTKALLGLDGVQKADVSLAEGTAIVTYDPAKVRLSQITDAVVDEGYAASVAR